jgi:hypothetical protein
VGNKLVEWHSLVARLAHISLYEGTNQFVWSLNKNGVFTVKSMYRHLINNGVSSTGNLAYEKYHLKSNILCFLKQGVILTKDNLARRHWIGSQDCCFCSKYETIQHLFFECHYAHFLCCSLHIVFGISSPRNKPLI